MRYAILLNTDLAKAVKEKASEEKHSIDEQFTDK